MQNIRQCGIQLNYKHTIFYLNTAIPTWTSHRTSPLQIVQAGCWCSNALGILPITFHNEWNFPMVALDCAVQSRLVTVQGQHCHSTSQWPPGLTDTQQVKQSVSQYDNEAPIHIVMILYLWRQTDQLQCSHIRMAVAVGVRSLDNYNTFSSNLHRKWKLTRNNDDNNFILYSIFHT